MVQPYCMRMVCLSAGSHWFPQQTGSMNGSMSHVRGRSAGMCYGGLLGAAPLAVWMDLRPGGSVGNTRHVEAPDGARRTYRVHCMLYHPQNTCAWSMLYSRCVGHVDVRRGTRGTFHA